MIVLQYWLDFFHQRDNILRSLSDSLIETKTERYKKDSDLSTSLFTLRHDREIHVMGRNELYSQSDRTDQ